jgi:hypothetical protein
MHFWDRLTGFHHFEYKAANRRRKLGIEMDTLSKTGNIEEPGSDNSDGDDDDDEDDSTGVLKVTQYVTELKESDLVGKWVQELNDYRPEFKCLKWGCEDRRNLRRDGRQRLAYPMEASLPLTYPVYVKVQEATDVEMSVDNGAEDVSQDADCQAVSDSQPAHEVPESAAKSDRVAPQSVEMTTDNPDVPCEGVVAVTTVVSDAQPVQQTIEEEEIDYEVDELVGNVSETELMQLHQISNEVELAQERAQAKSLLDERKHQYGFKWVASQESLMRVMNWDYQNSSEKGTVTTSNRFFTSGVKAFATLRNIQKDLTDFAYKLDAGDDKQRHEQVVFSHWVEILSAFRFGIFYAIAKLIHHSCFNFHVNYSPATTYSLDERKWANWLENLARASVAKHWMNEDDLQPRLHAEKDMIVFWCDENQINPYEFGLAAILVENHSIEDKLWLCAAPLVYWPIVTRYYAELYNLNVIVAIHRMSGPSHNRTNVVAYACDGRWYDRESVGVVFTQERAAHIKISFVINHRSGECGVVRHDLLHPYFENLLGLQFECTGDAVARWPLNMITQFMTALECGQKKTAMKHVECSGVLVLDHVPPHILQNHTYPMVVALEVIPAAIMYLVEYTDGKVSMAGFQGWTLPESDKALRDVQESLQVVTNQPGRSIPSDASHFWPCVPESKKRPEHDIKRAIGDDDDKIRPVGEYEQGKFSGHGKTSSSSSQGKSSGQFSRNTSAKVYKKR